MSERTSRRVAMMLVWIVGGVFVIYGLAFTFDPVGMAARVTGDAPGTPSAVIDMRATYGGMSIAVGVTILLLGSRVGMLPLALLVTAVVLLAMATTRLIGMVLDGSPNATMVVYLVSEIIGAALALYLRRSEA